MPQLKGLHIDRLLTNYSQRYSNAAFVNEVLFPEVKVEKESDLYAVYGLEMFNVYESRRANGGRSNEVDWTVGNDRYAAEQHSLSDILTDREISNADQPLTVEIDTVEFLQDALDLTKEYKAAQIARNAASYVNGNTEALSGTSQWSDYSNSKPLTDLKTIQTNIFRASRKMPNIIIIPTEVALVLALHPDILNLRRYTDPNLLSNSGLPPVLQGMKVVEAGAGYNTANPGQTAQLADVWGSDIIAAFSDPKPKVKSLTYGMTFRTNKYTRKWRDEEREGFKIEQNDIYDIKPVATGCGFLLQNVIA
jgi:hypothetical protein